MIIGVAVVATVAALTTQIAQAAVLPVADLSVQSFGSVTTSANRTALAEFTVRNLGPNGIPVDFNHPSIRLEFRFSTGIHVDAGALANGTTFTTCAEVFSRTGCNAKIPGLASGQQVVVNLPVIGDRGLRDGSVSLHVVGEASVEPQVPAGPNSGIAFIDFRF